MSGGSARPQQLRTTGLVPPIHRSVTYELDSQSYADIENGGLTEYWYSRYANPTNDLVAAEIATLENADRGYLTSSGMAAISAALLSRLSAGDHLVAARQLYGDTRDLLVQDLIHWGIRVDFVDVRDLLPGPVRSRKGQRRPCMSRPSPTRHCWRRIFRRSPRSRTPRGRR